jgi:hypothetical protein
MYLVQERKADFSETFGATKWTICSLERGAEMRQLRALLALFYFFHDPPYFSSLLKDPTLN